MKLVLGDGHYELGSRQSDGMSLREGQILHFAFRSIAFHLMVRRCVLGIFESGTSEGFILCFEFGVKGLRIWFHVGSNAAEGALAGMASSETAGINSSPDGAASTFPS